MVQFSAQMTLETLAPSTLKSYSKVINEYYAYIQSLEKVLVCFPVSPVHINLFTSHLYLKGQSPATITTKVSAFAYCHN